MRAITASVLLVMALVSAPAVLAITNGAPDGDGHPAVGALLAAQAYSDGTWAECSGTLISPTVFLTAAHCGDPGRTIVAVSFDAAYNPGRSKVFTGAWHGDPAYNQSASDPHDIAVVVFDKAVRGITPARLPGAGSLSNLAGNQQLTSVGYGGQGVTNGPGGKTISYADIRYVAVGTLNAINPAWLRISMNPATGNGGTCYGDSGGPNFLGAGATETAIVAATTITGDTWCRATNVVYRLDTPSARSFVAQFVTLP